MRRKKIPPWRQIEEEEKVEKKRRFRDFVFSRKKKNERDPIFDEIENQNALDNL